MKKIPLLLVLCLLILSKTYAQNDQPVIEANASRMIIPLDQQWHFHFLFDSRRDHQQIVDLPHIWDAQDALDGKMNYLRTTGIYEKTFFAGNSLEGKRIFLYFYGANSVAYVFLNNKLAGKHDGGYTAFCIEITGYLKLNAENTIRVEVSNAYNPDVAPLRGDFNVYGGLHRPVSLIITQPDCISPADYASAGVFLIQKKVTGQSANVEVKTVLSIQEPRKNLSVRTTVFDSTNKIVLTGTMKVNEPDSMTRQEIIIHHPHLWNGVADPYMYSAKVELLRNDQVIDEVTQPLGLRYFRVSADSGFFLNGKYLDLHGFGFHEDKAGIASAYRQADYDTDVALIRGMGANALRFTHYPHGNPMYDLCDKYGIVVWTEIPFVGGFTDDKPFKSHLRNMLVEMIRQHYNHPAIMFWGLENEIHVDGDDPVPFIKELDSIAHGEDNTRPTTIATDIQLPALNQVSDLIAYNRYFGWYGGKLADLASWADKTHAEKPGKPFALSEYGAGASIYQHAEKPESVTPSGKFHPEEWQTKFHEQSWAILKVRPYIWAKFIWCLTDFGSAIRNEGFSRGINDKGLITYDRKVKKDAYYFYKANWNPAPIIYITERRFTERKNPVTSIKVYTNLGKAELFVNGISMGVKKTDDLKRVIWDNVQLQPGVNKILVKAKSGNKDYTDHCEWILNKS
ncbi:MAG: glycoside hydrolase family 2 protein [Chitinophagaceae bacterium]|nr:MAG: glycoside hydrolase family 2 protein [Chitinophagaceae bacterium]